MGGCGRAKGFGGPEAPALNSALALGEGGGSTTADEWLLSVPVFAGVSPVFGPGDEAAVALPPSSDCSLGICKLSLGLFAPPVSPAIEDIDWFL